MCDVEQTLKNAINWNVLQRNTHDRCARNMHLPAITRSEAARSARRHQKNILSLNAQLRSLEEQPDGRYGNDLIG